MSVKYLDTFVEIAYVVMSLSNLLQNIDAFSNLSL